MEDKKADLMAQSKNIFEIYKKRDPKGQEYWSARDQIYTSHGHKLSF